MIPGYHTSALVEHDLATAGSVLRRIGFGAVAVRLNLARLDPLADQATRVWQIGMLASGIQGMEFVLDADGPFLVDPWLAQPPSLVAESADSLRQVQYLVAAVELAGELGGGLVSFSSGPMSSKLGLEGSLDHLAATVKRVSTVASECGVQVAIRPRTGHLVETIGGYERLLEWVGSDCRLLLAADVGVMALGGEMPILDLLGRLGERLGCVYLSDLRLSPGNEEPTLGAGHVSVNRVVGGLSGNFFVGRSNMPVSGGAGEASVNRFRGPVVLEPVPGQGMDPRAAEKLFQQVFRSGRERSGG